MSGIWNHKLVNGRLWYKDFQQSLFSEKGTSTVLEKAYLRLTKEPDASIIRPEAILKKTLELLLTKWHNKEVTYDYIADQFRSLRQDLTVQQIKNEFTARVYEENIRICLECDDINYFNQCQSQLMDLYRQGVVSENKPEFLCYRIIYYTLGEANNDLNKALTGLSEQDFASKEIAFAMRLRHHYTTGNTKAFFQMYKRGFLLTRNLIEMFIHRIRILSLRIITKSFGEKISAQYLSELLGFDSVEKFIEFITASKGILSEDKQFLMNKESFKIYDDHPWLTSKLTTHKLLVSQKAV